VILVLDNQPYFLKKLLQSKDKRVFW